MDGSWWVGQEVLDGVGAAAGARAAPPKPGGALPAASSERGAAADLADAAGCTSDPAMRDTSSTGDWSWLRSWLELLWLSMGVRSAELGDELRPRLLWSLSEPTSATDVAVRWCTSCRPARLAGAAAVVAAAVVASDSDGHAAVDEAPDRDGHADWSAGGGARAAAGVPCVGCGGCRVAWEAHVAPDGSDAVSSAPRPPDHALSSPRCFAPAGPAPLCWGVEFAAAVRCAAAAAACARAARSSTSCLMSGASSGSPYTLRQPGHCPEHFSLS